MNPKKNNVIDIKLVYDSAQTLLEYCHSNRGITL